MEVLLLLGALSLLLSFSEAKTDITVKIVDPPHQSRQFTTASTSGKKLTLRAPPANISGPPHLRVLAHECFKIQQRHYLYHICPFHNVTQKEETTAWNRFHGVLGIWREWIIEEDRFAGMLYSFGEKCGRTDREVKLMFKCSTLTRLTNITEPKTCKYTIWMWTPLACFKGAMQVYRVFTPKETEQWLSFNEEYHSELITKKGLMKKRHQLLLKAGLLYNFTIDDEYRKIETSGHANSPYSHLSPATSHHNLDQSLSKCQTRVSSLERELSDVKLKLDQYKKALSLDPQLKAQMEVLLVNVLNNTNRTSQRNQTIYKHQMIPDKHQTTTHHSQATTVSHKPVNHHQLNDQRVIAPGHQQNYKTKKSLNTSPNRPHPQDATKLPGHAKLNQTTIKASKQEIP